MWEGGPLEFVLSSMVVFSVGLCGWGVFIFCVVSCLEFLLSVTMFVYLNMCLVFSQELGCQQETTTEPEFFYFEKSKGHSTNKMVHEMAIEPMT
jgi:hypothetical protein